MVKRLIRIRWQNGGRVEMRIIAVSRPEKAVQDKGLPEVPSVSCQQVKSTDDSSLISTR